MIHGELLQHIREPGVPEGQRLKDSKTVRLGQGASFFPMIVAILVNSQKIDSIQKIWGPGRDSNPSRRIHSPIG